MDETLGDLFRSAEESPSYWAQVALLEFLQSLEAIRKSRGDLSRKGLAELVGVSPATLSRWLNGNENLTVNTMCRLASALGAAVHIHVADKNEKGRWSPEVGMARATNRHEPNDPLRKVTDLRAFKARREILEVTRGAQSSFDKEVASYSGEWRQGNG